MEGRRYRSSLGGDVAEDEVARRDPAYGGYCKESEAVEHKI